MRAEYALEFVLDDLAQEWGPEPVDEKPLVAIHVEQTVVEVEEAGEVKVFRF